MAKAIRTKAPPSQAPPQRGRGVPLDALDAVHGACTESTLWPVQDGPPQFRPRVRAVSPGRRNAKDGKWRAEGHLSEEGQTCQEERHRMSSKSP